MIAWHTRYIIENEIKSMKKFFILFSIIVITLFTFVRQACANELYKFTDANFDTSNSMIVLSGQDTPSGNVLQNIKLVKMQNPNRAYFDIDSSIITFPGSQIMGVPASETSAMRLPFLNLFRKKSIRSRSLYL